MSRQRRNPSKQRQKIEFEIKTLNKSQDLAIETIDNNTVTFLTGPAGTSKTHVATMYAIRELLEGRVDKIYLTRPAVEAGGEKLGALPGTAQEKSGEYLKPIFNIIAEWAGEDVSQSMAGAIEIVPIAYLRGWSLNHAVCIFDEAQNATKSQMSLYLSRLGKGSKMIICGDTDQCDIKNSVLQRTAELQCRHTSVGWHSFTFSDIVRHPLIQKLLQTMKEV